MATKAKEDKWTEADKARIPEKIPHYYFRKILTHNVNHDLMEGKNILLVGHAGVGKTSLYEQIACRMGEGHPVSRVNLNGQTTISDFVGMWGVKDGATYWIDGALPTAMKRGYLLILDEIDFAEPSILSVLNSVLEPNGKLFLKEKGDEVIKPHKDFRILATANTVGVMQEFKYMYPGANLLNAAFVDRFRVYRVDDLPPKQEQQVLKGSVPQLDDSFAEALVNFASTLRGMFKKQELQYLMSLRNLIDLGQMVIRTGRLAEETDYIEHSQIISQAIESILYGKMSEEDIETVKGVVGRLGLQNLE